MDKKRSAVDSKSIHKVIFDNFADAKIRKERIKSYTSNVIYNGFDLIKNGIAIVEKLSKVLNDVSKIQEAIDFLLIYAIFRGNNVPATKEESRGMTDAGWDKIDKFRRVLNLKKNVKPGTPPSTQSIARIASSFPHRLLVLKAYLVGVDIAPSPIGDEAKIPKGIDTWYLTPGLASIIPKTFSAAYIAFVKEFTRFTAPDATRNDATKLNDVLTRSERLTQQLISRSFFKDDEKEQFSIAAQTAYQQGINDRESFKTSDDISDEDFVINPLGDVSSSSSSGLKEAKKINVKPKSIETKLDEALKDAEKEDKRKKTPGKSKAEDSPTEKGLDMTKENVALITEWGLTYPDEIGQGNDFSDIAEKYKSTKYYKALLAAGSDSIDSYFQEE